MTFIILNIHVIFLNYKCINDHLWPISADFHYLYTDNLSDTITICNFILNTHTLHIYIHIYIHITIYLYIYLLKFFLMNMILFDLSVLVKQLEYVSLNDYYDM